MELPLLNFIKNLKAKLYNRSEPVCGHPILGIPSFNKENFFFVGRNDEILYLVFSSSSSQHYFPAFIPDVCLLPFLILIDDYLLQIKPTMARKASK